MTTDIKIGDKFVLFENSKVYVATIENRLPQGGGWIVDNTLFGKVIYDNEIERGIISGAPLFKFNSEHELLQLKLKYA